MAKSKTFVKLGPKAAGFADPYSRFKILRGQIKELETKEEKKSGKIERAIRGGHLVVVPEKEYKEYLESLKPESSPKTDKEEEPTLEEKLEEMTKKQLTAYYEENFDVKEEDVEAFGKMKHPEMVAELVALEDEEKE